MAAEPLPQALVAPVRATLGMLAHRESGSVTFHIKDGVLVTWTKAETHGA